MKIKHFMLFDVFIMNFCKSEINSLPINAFENEQEEQQETDPEITLIIDVSIDNIRSHYSNIILTDVFLNDYDLNRSQSFLAERIFRLRSALSYDYRNHNVNLFT